MTIFDQTDYKSYVTGWVKSQPKQGYGIYSKMAQYLDTTSVIISQVFSGDRDLNLEQAAKLAKFMALSAVETDYFLLLVQHARAGSHELRQILVRQLSELKKRSQAVKNRIDHKQLTDEDKAVFYSTWQYIAVWLAASIEGFQQKEFARRFGLADDKMADILRFLLKRGLLIKKGESYDFGKNVVHVAHDSPFVTKHHSNWRLKALQAMGDDSENSLHYSAPVSLSKELAAEIREELLKMIERRTKDIVASPSEELMCLNIDWFAY